MEYETGRFLSPLWTYPILDVMPERFDRPNAWGMLLLCAGRDGWGAWMRTDYNGRHTDRAFRAARNGLLTRITEGGYVYVYKGVARIEKLRDGGHIGSDVRVIDLYQMHVALREQIKMELGLNREPTLLELASHRKQVTPSLSEMVRTGQLERDWTAHKASLAAASSSMARRQLGEDFFRRYIAPARLHLGALVLLANSAPREEE